MLSSLAIHQGAAFRPSRGVALVAIVLLHAGLLLLALQQRRMERPEPAPAVIAVSLLAPRPAPGPPAPRELAPRLEQPAEAVLLPPDLVWEANEPLPDRAPAAAVQPAMAQAAPQPVQPAGAPLQISRAEYLRAPALRYPPAALAARREGTVGLRVLVGEDGRVIEIEIERPSGFAPFDEAACSAVRAAVFKPYTVNGVARVVLISIPIDFTLKRRGA